MPTSPIKFKTLYGKSSAKTAFRVHLLDLDFSKVRWYEDDPGATKYLLRWYCTTFSDKAHVVFVPNKDRPLIEDLCKACIQAAEIRLGLPNKYWEGGKKRLATAVVHPLLREKYERHLKNMERRNAKSTWYQSKRAPF